MKKIKEKKKKKCQLCDRIIKLYKVHPDKNLVEWWCAKCIWEEEHIFKHQPKRQPKRQLDCFGVDIYHNYGKISLPKKVADYDGHW